jgi:hypothetical protein
MVMGSKITGEQIITSQQSLWSVLLSLFGLVCGVAFLKFGIDALTGRISQGAFLMVAALLSGFLVLLGASIGLTSNYKVSLQGINVNHWWRRQYIKWADVSRITFITNLGWGYVVSIKLKSDQKREIALIPAFLGNGHQLSKAIIEAATLANPRINFVGMHEYGPPPYGIFTNKGSGS